ncbi:WC11 protein, partial [Cochlearius cochlearius]|nr:WC11 protein [Cochlearius cochlearius]
EFVALRLENTTDCSGRLQVFYNGTWGSVCSTAMTPKMVSLACQELGCGDGEFLEPRRAYGRVSGPTCLDHVEYGERNISFWQCPSTPWGPQSCDDLRDETHVTCTANSVPRRHWLCLLSRCPGRSLPSPDREKIHAVGGESQCSGRVELWHRSSWGTVCDDSWDMQDAQVACRQLGCGPAESALGRAAFGEGMGPVWLEQVECQGTEPSLQDCWALPGASSACWHKEDAAVRCSGLGYPSPTPLRGLVLPFMCSCHADPTWGHPTGSGRLSLPVIICVILGVLLCLLLALLAGQV